MRLLQTLLARSIALALIFTLCVFNLFAQQSTGNLRGQVTDQVGAVIIGATVTVTDAGGITKTTTTGNEGNYAFSGLVPGKYTVRATSIGFADYESPDVEIANGRNEPLTIKLGVAVEAQQVTVSAEAPLSTASENNGSAIVLRGADLDALPDDPDDLSAALQALAGPSAGPNGGQFFIDGFTDGRLPPKESIREIRINSNPFSAEFDRIGFGRVEIFTKPGSNKFHGQASFNFADESFDLVYSHGVLHHTPDTERAVHEIHRVLRPGGRAVVMLYHRNSYNYRININMLRRAGAHLLKHEAGLKLVHRLTAEPIDSLREHAGFIKSDVESYLAPDEFLNQHTDGAGNPLARVYSRQQARRLFRDFAEVKLATHFLNKRWLPVVGNLLPRALEARLAARWGWHLWIYARKGANQ